VGSFGSLIFWFSVNYGNIKNLKNKMNQAIHYYNQKMLKRHFLSLSEINSVINHYFFQKFNKISVR